MSHKKFSIHYTDKDNNDKISTVYFKRPTIRVMKELNELAKRSAEAVKVFNAEHAAEVQYISSPETTRNDLSKNNPDIKERASVYPNALSVITYTMFINEFKTIVDPKSIKPEIHDLFESDKIDGTDWEEQELDLIKEANSSFRDRLSV